MDLINKSVGIATLPNIRRYYSFISSLLDSQIENGILYKKYRDQHWDVLQIRVQQEIKSQQSSTTGSPFMLLGKMVTRICKEMGDEEDRRLLKEQPSILLLKYQTLLYQMTLRYQATGTLWRLDPREIVHEMNVVLLHRVWRKLSQFEGRSSFRTFMSKVIGNLLHETYNRLKREQLQHQVHYSIDELLDNTVVNDQTDACLLDAHPISQSVTKPILWQHYNQIFDWVLQEKNELSGFSERLFCLKINHRVLISPPDVFAFQANIAQVMLERFLIAFGESTPLQNMDYREMSKGALFNKLAGLVSAFRRKKVSGSTLQRTQSNWEKSVLEEMLSQMSISEAQQFDWEHFIHWKYA